MSLGPQRSLRSDQAGNLSEAALCFQNRREHPGKVGRALSNIDTLAILNHSCKRDCLQHRFRSDVANVGCRLRPASRSRVYANRINGASSAWSRHAAVLPSRVGDGLASPRVAGRSGRCAGGTDVDRCVGSAASASAECHYGCGRADFTSDWICFVSVVACRSVRVTDDSDQRNVEADIESAVGSWGRLPVATVGGDHWNCLSVGSVDRMASDDGAGGFVCNFSTHRWNGTTGHLDSLRTIHGRRHRYCGSSRRCGVMNSPTTVRRPRQRKHFTVSGLKKGNPRAWTLLVAELGPKITGYANRMGVPDGDEVMGATFETLARTIGTFEGSESQLRSYVFSIAHARIVDQLRRSTRRSEESIENTLALLEADEPTEETFNDPDLLAALSRLPEDQRRMLDLRYVVGLSTKETARAIGKSEVATRVAISRALSKLKDLLVDDLQGGGDTV